MHSEELDEPPQPDKRHLNRRYEATRKTKDQGQRKTKKRRNQAYNDMNDESQDEDEEQSDEEDHNGDEDELSDDYEEYEDDEHGTAQIIAKR